MVKRILHIAWRIFLIYFLIGFLIPPMFQKESPARCAPSFPVSSACLDRVLCIDDNQEALLWRLRMIAAAQEEIIVSTFDWKGDESGHAIMAALAEAAERGVRVRVLVDGMTAKAHVLHDGQFRALSLLSNVEVKLYNPPNLLCPWSYHYRMHDKYMIVDDTAYLASGRNLYDLFLSGECDSSNKDRDILIYTANTASSSLDKIRNYFIQIWRLESNRAFQPIAGRPSTQRGREVLLESSSSLPEQFPDAYTAVDWIEATLPAAGISLLTNPIEPQNKVPTLWSELSALMLNSNRARIQTPYIVCNSAMYGDLRDICQRSESVQIMTNAVENGANPFGCCDYLNQKEDILATGATVLEWMGGESLHTKTVLLDDRYSVIGSFNMDMRSTYLDTEIMLVIDSPELNQLLQEKFNGMSQASKYVYPDGREQLGAECEEIAYSFGKNCFYTVFRLLLYPFRYLL